MLQGVKNIKITQDGLDFDQVKLIIICPQSHWWTDVYPGCGCKKFSAYSCPFCKGTLWIDKMGNTFCTRACSRNGTTSIFEHDFKCNKGTTTRIKLTHLPKLVRALNLCVGECDDGGAMNDI